MLLNYHISAYARCLAGKVCGLVRSTWGISQGDDKLGARDKMHNTKVARTRANVDGGVGSQTTIQSYLSRGGGVSAGAVSGTPGTQPPSEFMGATRLATGTHQPQAHTTPALATPPPPPHIPADIPTSGWVGRQKTA